MHIKSIIIEGFKSYAQRTEINGFDPLFNAITGLNGSGKSNILDSICFLLGISNLSHVSVLYIYMCVCRPTVKGADVASLFWLVVPEGASLEPSGFGLQKRTRRDHEGHRVHHL